MEFLMQLVNSRTLIEEVNDSDIPMEPLRYPVLSMPAAELPTASASSVDALICSATALATGEGADRPQASEHSIQQVDPQAPGWTRRKCLAANTGLGLELQHQAVSPNPDRMTAFEKSVRVFAEAPGENVIVPKIRISFDTLGEAYDFYNLYSWEKGFGIRYGKSRLNVNRTKCMQEIVCGCAGKLIVENTRSCRCECPALVRLLRSKDNGWYIAEHQDEHNHSLSPTYGQTLHWPSHKHIDVYNRDSIIGSFFGKMENVPFTKKALRNLCGKIGRDQAEDDVRKTMEVFQELGAKDQQFTYKVQADKDGRISTLMWANGNSRLQYTFFGDVVI